MISPLAAGVGAGLGAAIGSAIQEGVQRRANRRNCLLIKGWRLVEVPQPERARIARLTDAERSAYFDTIVGSTSVTGEVTERTTFHTPTDSMLDPSGAVEGPRALFLGKKVNPSLPLALNANEGALVLAFRRPDAGSAGRSGSLAIARYDPDKRDLVYRPKDWKKNGDQTTYGIDVRSADRKAAYEVQVVRLTAGDYVITGTAAGPVPSATAYCFGAPTFRVETGEVVYLGDFVPYIAAPLSTGTKLTGLAYTAKIDDARGVLAKSQPALAAAMKPAEIRNQATFACSAVAMDRWDVPDVEPVPPAQLTVADSRR